VGSVNESVPGSYTVQYTVCDPIGNCSDPFFLQVDVQDTVPPVVTLLGPNPLILDVYATNTNPFGVEASDNYYSSSSLIYITDNKVNANKLGDYVVTYTVKDGSGNTTVIERQVKIVDRSAPVIELLGGNPFDLAWMDTFNLAEEVRITDNYYTPEVLLTLVQKTTTLTVDPVTGKYYGAERGWKEITYQVTDPSNNTSAKVKRTIYVDFRSGLNEAKADNQLAVYPNPSNGKFTLETKQALNGKTEVVLYNMLGAKVATQDVVPLGNNIDMNVQGLKPGIYLVQLTNNGNTFSQRITIK
jgi:hypothetical protein